jgi:hypothetical protein
MFNFIVALAVLYSCLAVPYKIALTDQFYNNKLELDILVCDIILFIDIIVTFFTPYYKEYKLIDSPSLISQRYLKGMFIPDLLATPPLYLINYNLMWLKMTRLLKLNRVTAWMERDKVHTSYAPDYFFNNWTTKDHTVQLIKFIIYVIIMTHVFACFWYYISKQTYDGDENWAEGYEYNHIGDYILSLYWAVYTISTVGYGDVTPVSTIEYFYTMLIEFIGVLFFAFLMANASTLITSYNIIQQARIQKQINLDKWLLKLDKNKPDGPFDPKLFTAIKLYFEYMWRNDHSYAIEDIQYLKRMPPNLHNKLYKELFRYKVEKFDFYMQDFPKKLKYALVANIQPRLYQKYEEIIVQGKMVNDLNFIREGSVLLGTKGGFHIFLKLPTDSYFGDEFMLFKLPSPISYM